jgi:hypothetical protein
VILSQIPVSSSLGVVEQVWLLFSLFSVGPTFRPSPPSPSSFSPFPPPFSLLLLLRGQVC